MEGQILRDREPDVAAATVPPKGVLLGREYVSRGIVRCLKRYRRGRDAQAAAL
jgi:hypothetical protein